MIFNSEFNIGHEKFCCAQYDFLEKNVPIDLGHGQGVEIMQQDNGINPIILVALLHMSHVHVHSNETFLNKRFVPMIRTFLAKW